jgi:ABC-type uncharacterized transport system YnjBCD ATPase subunit
LLRPDAGTIELFGQPLARHRSEILTKTGSLVETPSLYPRLTGRENLEITRRILDVPRSEIDRVLALAGLENRSRHLVRTCSLGMKQRLGLALALLGQRELLLLDEPMNGLDPAGMNETPDYGPWFPWSMSMYAIRAATANVAAATADPSSRVLLIGIAGALAAAIAGAIEFSRREIN